MNVGLASGQQLRIMRTAPPHRTSNNDGLILLFEDGTRLGLLPGDCVYDDIAADGNTHVSSLLLVCPMRQLSFRTMEIQLAPGACRRQLGIPKRSFLLAITSNTNIQAQVP